MKVIRVRIFKILSNFRPLLTHFFLGGRSRRNWRIAKNWSSVECKSALKLVGCSPFVLGLLLSSSRSFLIRILDTWSFRAFNQMCVSFSKGRPRQPLSASVSLRDYWRFTENVKMSSSSLKSCRQKLKTLCKLSGIFLFTDTSVFVWQLGKEQHECCTSGTSSTNISTSHQDVVCCLKRSNGSQGKKDTFLDRNKDYIFLRRLFIIISEQTLAYVCTYVDMESMED